MELVALLSSCWIAVPIAALYVGWWALGDFVLDQIGIPFFDTGRPRESPDA